MGTPDTEGRRSAPQIDGILTNFFSSDAWIDGRAQQQLRQVAAWNGVTKIAAFPDLHPGKYGPVGCAVQSDVIYPQLIGNDIGCGMALFQLDLPLRKFKLEKAVRRLRALGDPPDTVEGALLEQHGLATDMVPEALGTIGGGNHFCEVQTLSARETGCDLDPDLCYLLVHSGSRGLGAATLAALPETAFEGLRADCEVGASYVRAHGQAVRWAALNRAMIADRAARALRADVRLLCDVPHNLLTQTLAGWLHRKGAAVAGGLVPVAGSRASPSYLVKSLDPPAALGALAHGAGRRYDRASMHGRVGGKRSDLAAMTRTAFGGRVICEDRDLLIEEAPQAYKSARLVVDDLELTGVARRVATFNPLVTFKKTRLEAGT
ncbi:MAG: RNA ligase RtcB family protein [Sedimentitalea sp.]